MRKSLLILLALLPLPNLFAAAIDIRVPTGIVDGNQDSSLPFTSIHQPVRYQEVFNASDFSAISSGGAYISVIRFRGDETFGGGFAGAITNLQLNLSTTSRGADGLSSVFADNIGMDNKVVFGPKGISIGNSPGSYLTAFSLSQPFFYNPSAGNLLLDVRNFSGTDFIGGHIFDLDAQSAVGDTISSVYALDANASSGTTQTSGLLAEFLVTPVPEPSTYTLAGFGTLMLLVARYIQTKTKNRKAKQKWH